MAEQENTEKSKTAEPSATKAEGPLTKLLPWLIPTLVVLVFAAGGFLIGRSFGTRGQAQNASGAEPGTAAAEPAPSKEPPLKANTGEGWYYDLDPVVVNLNEPGVTRYARVGLTLEVGSTMDEKEGRPFLDQKKPLMKHWLTLFLSNQTTEDTRGEKNLTRMESQICETFNSNLFPSAKGRINGILFREFAIQ
ncbi:MAG: flagellar basal body-associated FliL family protein [Phycisphaerae bacterium]|nr:flagellar basal body-associated FliL family protein [Phycisphaerae bacterium]